MANRKYEKYVAERIALFCVDYEENPLQIKKQWLAYLTGKPIRNRLSGIELAACIADLAYREGISLTVAESIFRDSLYGIDGERRIKWSTFIGKN